MSAPAEARAVQVRVAGTVQGVGFRPYVYRLATAYGLAGEVRNTAGGVDVRVCGPARAVDAFLARLPVQAPPAARIVAVTERELPLGGPPATGFRIVASGP